MRHIIPILTLLFIFSCTPISQNRKGWPSDNENIRVGFSNPPKGYGNVPFYWWTADSLNITRLSEQLDILSEASTDGLCVSYSHTNPAIDTVGYEGKGGLFGHVSGGCPQALSEKWYHIWNDFSRLCAEKAVGIGLDDYVVGWPGNGKYVDSILMQPDFKNFPGRLVYSEDTVPDNSILVTENIYAIPSCELHPDFGKEMVNKYFETFNGSKSSNYFFQDELVYNLSITSYCPGMDSIFKARKGYDILPYLDRMFITKDSLIDSLAAKVRLDYAEVLTELAEERYFKPVYKWHADKGLIYGCDNIGRGTEPLSYLDYFRAISWFTAPGNDAPARGSSFRQTKVSSSISHLYKRPRTWLEAFHSMGWDANGGILTRQLDHHLIAGGNLLCMHGLYYSTHGGWWEWAPPCFHFRMPYWPHMKYWLKYAERMCYVLSQGHHIADIAILYPTETLQAYPESSSEAMFETAMKLSNHGLDYDFIDYKSLQNSSVSDGVIKTDNEEYKILLLIGTRAMHEKTREQIDMFVENGGIVISDTTEIVSRIRQTITPDFRTASGVGKVLHREVGTDEVYMIMDVPNGDKMTFRSIGKPEIWNAMDGTISEIPVLASNDSTTTLICSEENGNSMLIVFDKTKKPEFLTAETKQYALLDSIHIDGDWNVEIIPTMNNKWGDFRLPATDELIGVEAREFYYMPYDSVPLTMPEINWTSKSVYGYAPYMKDQDGNPYLFSWQYGVFDSPGSQGYHGLKAKVDDRFLILDKGSDQSFVTDFYAPESSEYTVLIKGVTPDQLSIDGMPNHDKDVNVTKGWHSLSLLYKNTKHVDYSLVGMRGATIDHRDRSMVMIYPKGKLPVVSPGLFDTIVSSSWYGTDFLKFGNRNDSLYMYNFKTAPGTVSMSMKVKGTVERIWVNGEEIKQTGSEISVPYSHYVSDVVICAKPELGFPGTAFFLEPVKMKCLDGKMKEGDWTNVGALKYFSGGIRYSKDINIERKPSKVVLNLGMVDATCEVAINGKKAGILLNSPYEIDITNLIDESNNRIEVLVYSSLSNHYQSIPSPYKGNPRAGLIGPVRLLTYEPKW